MARWKTAVWVTGVAAAGYLGTTWWMGTKVEAAMADNDKRLESQLPFVKVVDRKFERGLFRSTETDTLSLRAFGREFTQLTLTSTIKNGPVAGLSLAAAVIDSELRATGEHQQEVAGWLGGGPLLTAHTTVRLTGTGGDALLSMPAADTAHLKWSGAMLKIAFAGKPAHITVQGDVPAMELIADDGATVKVTGVHLEEDQQQLFADEPALYAGQQKFTVAQLAVRPSPIAGLFALPALSLGGIELSGSAALANDSEFLDYAVQTSAKTLEVNAENYGPARMQMTLNHVHARSMVEVIKVSRTAWDQPMGDAATAQTVLDQEMGLFKHGMQMRLDRLSFTTPGGEATLTLSLVPKADAADFSNPAALSRAFDLKVTASVPENFVHGLQRKFEPAGRSDRELGAEREAIIGRGLVLRKGPMLEASFEQNNGETLINGTVQNSPLAPAPAANQAPGRTMRMPAR